MESAETSASHAGPSRFLVVTARGRLCAVLLSNVVEIMRPLPVEPVSGMPQFVLGLAIVRGAPAPVLSLAAVLNGSSSETPGRFVTLRVGARVVSLAVHEVLGVRAIDPAELEALPPLLQGEQGGAVEMIGSLDAQLLVVLRSSRLLSDEAWQSLAAGKAEGQ